MIQSHDHSDKRLRLYTVWKWVGCVFGLLAMFGFYLTFYLLFNQFANDWCCTGYVDAYTCATCVDAIQQLSVYVLVSGIANVVIYGIFRFYFLSVMKKYWEEGVA